MKLQTKHLIFFCIFVLLFFFPYLIAVKEFSALEVSGAYVLKVYSYSGMQALISAFGTLLIGCIGALGLFWLRTKVRAVTYAACEFFIMLPSLLPALFIVVSCLNVIPFFPFGLTGVILLHVISEVGLTSIIVQRLFYQRFSPYLEWSQLTGCSTFFFLRKNFRLVLPDLAPVFAILFVFFLTSVSIPLMIGGGSFTSLEFAIYEKILVSHDWNQAVNLFFYQFLFIAGITGLLHLIPRSIGEAVEKTKAPLLSRAFGLIPLVTPIGIILAGMLYKFPRGLGSLINQPQMLQGWDRYLLGSLLIGFLTGGAVFIGLSIMTYFLQMKSLRKFFLAFLTPSFVILAFSFLLLPGEGFSASYVKIAWALMIAFLPTLFRLGLLQKMNVLDNQIEMASFLGGSPAYVFRKVVWPQSLPTISLMSGLASVWAMGDFALSRVIAGRDLSLAMWVQSLVDQYRWDMALVLSWLIFLASFIVFSFFWGLSYVSRQKLI